jgi:hypothetical protein
MLIFKTKFAHLRKFSSFEDLLLSGLIEYLDVNEESDSLISVYEKDITR